MNKNQLKKVRHFDLGLLPVIKHLAAEGRDIADIGMIIGYTGRNPKKFITDLAEEYPDVKYALEIGKRVADVELVTTAFEAATGFGYVETVKEWVYEDVVNEKGELTGERIKVLVKEKKYKRHTKPDASILKMLLISRLPDKFTDSKKGMPENPLDRADPTEDELRRFAGAILNMIDKKKIESHEVINSG